MARYIVGITGASGSIYGLRLVEEIIKQKHEVYLVVTYNGKKVFEYELDIDLDRWVENLNTNYGGIRLCDVSDMFSPIASGSFQIEGMVIAPCSMGTLAKISCGITGNLLIRAADAAIKEKRKLILVPRETPLNSIHLKNMLVLSDLNVTILPPVPSFYHKPKTLAEVVNTTVGRILQGLGIQNNLHCEWEGKL